MKNKPAILGGDKIFNDKINIVRPFLPTFDEISDEVDEILKSGILTKGDYLTAFEEAIKSHLSVKHAIAVSSCTTGLMLTYKWMGSHGKVIVPSFTFIATISALLWAGLRPTFVDVDINTFNIAPDAIESAITPETIGIVAVHNYGNPADMDTLPQIAERNSLKLICDAAHGFGSLYKGMPVGAQGDAQIFSLSPTKLLICGEGGIVATNNDELASFIRIAREYGNDGKYDCIIPGINARMPEFNAIIGLHSLKKLEQSAVHRNWIASCFCQKLGKLPGVTFQQVQPGNRNSYKEFTIIIDNDSFGLSRDELAIALAAENIDSRKYYDPPAHLQTAFRHHGDGCHLPQTEYLSRNCLSLPIWSHMDEEVVLSICTAVIRIHENADKIHSMLMN